MGAAKIWIDGVADIFRTWNDFVKQFLNDFPSKINIADIHIEMMEMKWELKQPFEEYYYKMSLGRKIQLSYESIIKYTINGIVNNDVKKAICAISFENCNQLLNLV